MPDAPPFAGKIPRMLMVKIYANNALTYSKVTKLLALKVVLTHVAVNAEVTARIFIKDSGGG